MSALERWRVGGLGRGAPTRAAARQDAVRRGALIADELSEGMGYAL